MAVSTFRLLALFGTIISTLVHASPLNTRATVHPVSASEVASFQPYSYYAAAGYCKPELILKWACGISCSNLTTFTPVAAGGDGTLVQFWYVGYDTSLKSVIVSRQGTHAENILPLITDANIFFDTLDPDLFPGLSNDVQVHGGFGGQQMLAAKAVLAAVKSTMSKFSTQKVTLSGHSMGGALALLDAVYLELQLPKTTVFKVVTYGLPRIGNQEFADYVDSKFQITRVTNKKDLVPILPGRHLGYHHPSGEKHIQADGSWVACDGQDNTDSKCTIGTVPNIFVGDANDHKGLYDGVRMSTSTCAGED